MLPDALLRMQGQPQDLVYDCSTLLYVRKATAQYGASRDSNGNLVDPGVCCYVCYGVLTVCWLYSHCVLAGCVYDDRLFRCVLAACAGCVSFVC